MFIFPSHKDNFEKLLQRDGTDLRDVERKAMFYIFAGCEEINDRIEDFYNFDDRMICNDDDEVKAILSSSSVALVMLGYNLYNNYPSGTIMDIFRNFDKVNCELALQGIRIRLGKQLDNN